MGNNSCEDDFVEKDPTGRYVRYDEILGKGAFKAVYKAFDEVDGIEVAWNQVNIEDVIQSPEQLQRLYSEVHLLKSLNHENIIKCYNSWVDDKNRTINMITELFTSGSLRQYRRKHRNVDLKAIKNWSRQILRGLLYLHSHNPPIIHRDLKCDNVFVNGNNGEVKIGDLGLATVMQQPTAKSVIGTPEFMAPELYDEEYNELVDIYSFGMCILEMVTCDYPYSECKNPAQIYKKVTSGIKPAALGKVDDPQVRQFIDKCIAPASARMPVAGLLKDPFLATESSKELNCNSLQLPTLMPNRPKQVDMLQAVPYPMDIDAYHKKLSGGTFTRLTNESLRISTLEIQSCTKSNEFRLRGEKNNDDTIELTLRITDRCGRGKTIQFAFYLQSDNTLSIAEEMAEQLDLSNEDVVFIAELIDNLIMQLVPRRNSSLESTSSLPSSSFGLQNHTTANVISAHAELPRAIATRRQNSQKSVISSTSVELMAPDAMTMTIKPLGSSEYLLGSGSCDSGLDFHVPENDISRNNGSLRTSGTSHMESYYSTPKSTSLTSICSLSLDDRDQQDELKLEIGVIDMQYNQCFKELWRKREEAIENTKRRWMMKKKIPVM